LSQRLNEPMNERCTGLHAMVLADRSHALRYGIGDVRRRIRAIGMTGHVPA
jgi:hypothetical protein